MNIAESVSLQHAASLVRVYSKHPLLQPFANLTTAMNILADAAEELDVWRSLQRAAQAVPQVEAWMCNEHIRLFREFLAAREAYKNGTPWPNRGVAPSMFDVVKSWFS